MSLNRASTDRCPTPRRAARDVRLRVLAAAVLVCVASTDASAQERRPNRGGAERGGPRIVGDGPGQPGRAAGSPLQPFFSDLNEWLESDLVALMKQRSTTGPDLLPRLELQIDLRVIARWLLLKSADAPAGSELQSCTYLRAMHVLGAAGHVAAHTQRSGKPTPPQAEAMGRLRELTFRLGDNTTAKDADELCRNVGALLVVAGGPMPPNVKELTLMRPPAPPATQKSARDAAPSLWELSERVKNLAVSAPLRQQLIELSQAAERASKAANAPPGNTRLPPAPGAPSAKPSHDDAAALVGMLERAVAMADALQKGLAVGEQGRARMENQLTEGLVLFTDPRLRAAGARRVNALDQYRRTVERIRGLNLTPAMQKRLAPVFIYAQENVDKGPKAIEAIEAYLELCARHDTRSSAAAHGVKPGEREAKVLDELGRQFAAERAEFIETAVALGGGGGAQSASAAAAGPESLDPPLARMRTVLDLLMTVEKVPRALQLLNTHKPKPFGGLEKRVNVALVALAERKPSLAKDDAARFLPELVTLAGYAGELAGPGGDAPAEGGATAAGIPADVVKAYTRGKLAGVENKCRELIADQLHQLASGRYLEEAKIARLEQARSLSAGLREAADLEAGLRRADVLVRWADWSIDPAALRAVLAPYREALASSYEAFADDVVPPVAWAKVRSRYAPVIELVKDAATRAEACAALPTGIVGELSKLVTPLAGAPFATERFASLGLTAWSRYEQSSDTKNASAAADMVAAGLKR